MALRAVLASQSFVKLCRPFATSKVSDIVYFKECLPFVTFQSSRSHGYNSYQRAQDFGGSNRSLYGVMGLSLLGGLYLYKEGIGARVHANDNPQILDHLLKVGGNKFFRFGIPVFVTDDPAVVVKKYVDNLTSLNNERLNKALLEEANKARNTDEVSTRRV